MQWIAILINFLYAVMGGIITITFMWFGYKIFDHITPFDTADELKKGNMAVGLVVLGVLLGIGIAIGLVIGMGLN
ncbi:DUF350 domain-containing protein [candidate division KSB1 bacterium]